MSWYSPQQPEWGRLDNHGWAQWSCVNWATLQKLTSLLSSSCQRHPFSTGISKHGGFKEDSDNQRAWGFKDNSHTSKKSVPYSDEELETIAKNFKMNIKDCVTLSSKECRKFLASHSLSRDEKQIQDRVKNFTRNWHFTTISSSTFLCILYIYWT